MSKFYFPIWRERIRYLIIGFLIFFTAIGFIRRLLGVS